MNGFLQKQITTIVDFKGKGRTGVVSAIILKKLGYDEETIIEDYLKSKENLLDFLKRLCKKHPQVDINTIIPNDNNNCL